MAEIEKKQRLIKAWKAKGASVEPLSASRMQSSGHPDAWIAWRGCCFFVEFKDVSTPVRLNQRLRIRELIERGCLACIVRFTEDPATVSVEIEGQAPYPFESANLLEHLYFECRKLSQKTFDRFTF